MTQRQLYALSLLPAYRAIMRSWFATVERHYLMCADVEAQRVREAQSNVAYYQRKAALARSEKASLQ